MTNEERQALINFLLDAGCLRELENRAVDINLFDILKVTNMEIRHSNILAWLFDPNESHMIGDAFIKSFVTRLIKSCPSYMDDPFKLLLQDFYTYQVYRESNHMDVVIYSKEEKTAIVIENKVWSGEGAKQLETYKEKSKSEYRDCHTILYVFLTPDGRDASDPDTWISFSYGDMIECLEASIFGLNLKDEVQLIINNYISAVRKKIMKEKDVELFNLCNEIYSKHKTALRLIFENVQIDNSLDTEIICSELKALCDDGKIIYEPEYGLKFFTSQMDTFLPPLKDKNSSWYTNYVYWYWFEKYEESLIIHFELGGWNLPTETRKNMEALINAKNKTFDNFRFKRLLFGKEKLNPNTYESSLRSAVKKLVEKALNFEEDILKKANNLLSSSSN